MRLPISHGSTTDARLPVPLVGRTPDGCPETPVPRPLPRGRGEAFVIVSHTHPLPGTLAEPAPLSLAVSPTVRTQHGQRPRRSLFVQGPCLVGRRTSRSVAWCVQAEMAGAVTQRSEPSFPPGMAGEVGYSRQREGAES